MTEAQAKRHLAGMLRSFTPGSVLPLLAELFRERAARAGREGDAGACQRFKSAELTLFVVGLGVEAACPR